MSQTVKCSWLIQKSNTAFNDASTSDTVPVIMTVPENLSTKPILAFDAFIHTSAAIIAVSVPFVFPPINNFDLFEKGIN